MPGVAEFVPLDKITEEHFRQTFRHQDVKGTLFTVQKALPLLKDGGSIILTGSVAGVKGDLASSACTARPMPRCVPFVRTWTSISRIKPHSLKCR